MDQAELGEVLGGLTAKIAAVELQQTEIFRMLQLINDTLSQAKGAQRIFVWIIGTLFAAVALAKGWVWAK